METIQALQDALGISPTMLVRTVLGVSSGQSGGFGPVALFGMILVGGILGRYIFVVVMCHVRPFNPLSDMGRGQMLLWALVLIPTAILVLGGSGPVQARMEARFLEPLGWSRGPAPPADACAPAAAPPPAPGGAPETTRASAPAAAPAAAAPPCPAPETPATAG